MEASRTPTAISVARRKSNRSPTYTCVSNCKDSRGKKGGRRYLARRQRYVVGLRFSASPLKRNFRDYTKTQRGLLYSLIRSGRWINPSIFTASPHTASFPCSLSLSLSLSLSVYTYVCVRVSRSSVSFTPPFWLCVCSGLFTDTVTDVSRENPRASSPPAIADGPGFRILPR